jgi:cyanophycinase
MLLGTLPLFFASSGAVMLVGGGSTTTDMVERFAKLCGGKSGLVIVLAQTREQPANGASSADLLTKNGFTKLKLIDKKEFTEADRDELEKQLNEATGVWVPGGDQNLFTKRLGAEWCQRVFPKLVQRGLNWFGTSAGAMVASNPMIGGNQADGGAKVVEGIGIVDALVDTHYRTRKRENRLRNAFFGYRHEIAVGLDEGEWVILRNGVIEDQFGKPHVIVRE